MLILFIVGASVVLQLIAVALALRLIKVTRSQGAWLVMAFAILLMAVRRSIVFYHLVSGHAAYSPDIAAELVALTISFLLICAVAMIGPIFRSIERSRSELDNFKTTLDQTLDCVFIFDPETLKFSYINRGAVDQLGYTREELLRMTPLDIKPVLDRHSFLELISPLMEGGKASITFETVHRHKNGGLIPVEIFLQYISPPGEKERFVAIVRDITERRRVEGELKVYRESLEHLVEARTAKLKSVNEQLIEQIREREKAEKELIENEERLRIMTSSVNDAIIMLNGDGKLSFWNPAAERMFGYSRDEIIGKDIVPLIIPVKFREKHAQKFAAFQATGQGPVVGKSIELTGLRKSGAEFPIELSISSIRLEGRWGAVGSIRDITERKRAEERLVLSAKVIESAQEGIFITNAGGEIISVNPAFTHITGYTQKEVTGRNPRILRSDRHDGEFFGNMWRELKETGKWKGEIWNRRKNGELYPQWTTIAAIKDAGGETAEYVCVLQDISEAKRYEAKISHMAYHDPLTDLPNRQLFEDRLHQAIARANRNKNQMALLFIDLDGFKKVNDTFGHKAGDLLLQEVAQRLLPIMREGDTVARLGGDEFVVLIENVEKFPLAIGYESSVFAREKLVKVLSVEGVVPTSENIKNKRYPFWRVLSLGVNKSHMENNAMKGFVDFIFSPEGRKILSGKLVAISREKL